jgi:A/G-specific adenine glycosylase
MKDIIEFQNIVWQYYADHGRHNLLWRKDITPYKIIVSELMLQQTQVSRVNIKFAEFMSVFPDFTTLSRASLGEVLSVWQGLGYSRRAKFLHQTAQIITQVHNGIAPSDSNTLVSLPGIGKNTAGAILAYSYNTPSVFIETNIRRVFIHHFFPDIVEVNDRDLLPLVELAVPHNRAREWYWALMDYGSSIPKTITNPNRQSAHHKKQKPFEGSNRQVRSTILNNITKNPLSKDQIIQLFSPDESRIDSNLSDLIEERFIVLEDTTYKIRDSA